MVMVLNTIRLIMLLFGARLNEAMTGSCVDDLSQDLV